MIRYLLTVPTPILFAAAFALLAATYTVINRALDAL